MKKFTLTLAALAMTTASAFAAATLPFADGIYTIEGGSTSAHRGFLAAGEGYTEYPVLSDIGWSNYSQNSTTAIEDGKYWYITANGTATGYYVYNVALNKFLSGEGSSVHFSDNPYNWEIVDNLQDGVTYTSIKYVSFACGTQPQNVNYHWQADDGGSTHTMTLIADGLTTYAEAVANAETAINAAEPVLIHELADIDNESVYTINSEGRGYLYYNSENTTQLYSSSHTNITDDAAPIDNSSAWFAILRTDKTAEGQYYIYNTAAQKFLSWSGTGVAVDLVEDASYTWSITVENGFFLIKVPETEQTYINVTNWQATNGCKVTSTGPDEGNRMELTSVPSHGVDLSAAKAKINAVEASQQDITFTFPEFGGHSLTMTASTMTGVDAQDVIPSVPFFTATGLEGDDTIVSAENTAFTVIGTWAFPFEDEEVYRIDIRKKGATDNGTCSNLLYNATTNQVDTRNETDADAFVPERLFYLDAKGFDATGNLKVTLHTIAVDANKGFQVGTTTKAIGTFTETPVEFLVVTNSSGTDGVSLRHPDAANCHVNDIDAHLGVWTDARSQNDVGSFLRFGELTDADFDGLMSGDLADAANAAKVSKKATEVRALFDAAAPYFAAVAEAEALLASIANYTADHFGEDLGYFYGTDYDAIAALAVALQGTLEGTDVAAITAATAALAEEVAKVQVHLPEAGKFYRFQNKHSNLYMTSIVNDANDLTLVENGADALETIFYFDGTRLVAWQNGLVLGNYKADETEDSWKTVLKGASNEGEITFPVSDVFGSFYIQTQLDRRLYGGADTGRGSAVDCAALSTGEKYSWVITEATELPIAYNEGFVWSTLYSPVQLGLIENKVKAYTGTLNDEDPENVTLVVTELTGSIPANTGVILGVVKSDDIVVNGYVYLPIEDNTADEVASALVGSLYTVAQEEAATAAEGDQVYNFLFKEDTVEDPETNEESNFGKFNLDMASDLVGFTAYVTASSIDSDEVITIADSEGNNPTGIEEINVESDKVQGIYDLQGRRLSAPVKGINIINGKKVLVK